MNFFLDENFPKNATLKLRERGIKVFDIRGTEKEGITDEEIFQLCKLERAIFLTTDKDFYHTIHLTHKPHFGIIVIALSKPNATLIIQKLEWFLNTFKQTEHNNTCYLILDYKCKIFK